MDRLRCFVAMAFGHKEIDELYDNVIVPVLRKLQIVPVRVDRVEHNEDIDDRIVIELHAADLAIADLTYARPSVYYEAGYAERSVPVIYTARLDHFKPQSNDPFGNFRVHFDLQMKNTIAWDPSAVDDFSLRLHKRLNKVVAPLLKARRAATVSAAREIAFRSLAIQMQRELAAKAATETFRRAGFEMEALSTSEGDGPKGVVAPSSAIIGAPRSFRTASLIHAAAAGCIFGLKLRDSRFRFVSFTVFDRISQKRIAESVRPFVTVAAFNLNYKEAVNAVVEIQEDHFLCSLGSTSLAPVRAALMEFHGEKGGSTLTLMTTQSVPEISGAGSMFFIGNNGLFDMYVEGGGAYISVSRDAMRVPPSTRQVARITRVHLLGGIRGEDDVRNRINEALGVAEQ